MGNRNRKAERRKGGKHSTSNAQRSSGEEARREDGLRERIGTAEADALQWGFLGRWQHSGVPKTASWERGQDEGDEAFNVQCPTVRAGRALTSNAQVEACGMTGWRVHAWILMSNNYHFFTIGCYEVD
jgi:hypothetical protein